MCIICFEQVINSNLQILQQCNCVYDVCDTCIYNWYRTKNECLICVDDWDKIDKDGIGKKNAEFVGEDWSNINFNIIKDKIKDRLVGNPFMIDNYKLMIKLKAK